jgi:soluble lytic murein transglycosylase-like protein
MACPRPLRPRPVLLPSVPTSPLIVFPGAQVFQPGSSALSADQVTASIGELTLTAALQSAMAADPAERFIVIPGAMKREQNTDELQLSRRRMSPRLRHGIILGVLLLVIMTILTSLVPLANGQSANPIFLGVTRWVPIQQLAWQIQSHIVSTPQNTPAPTLAQNTPGTQSNPPIMYLPQSQYVAIAQQDASAAGISPDYFVRQINVESGFNPNAVSPAGAVGIAQFLPSTAAGLGINPWDPVQALGGAARLMASYAHTYGGDYAKALAAYNGGSGTVQHAVNACGANWMNCLPPETRHYISVIMGI